MLGNNYSMVYVPNKRLSMAYIGASACLSIASLLTIISFSGPYWLHNDSTELNQVTNLGLWEVRFIKYLCGCLI